MLILFTIIIGLFFILLELPQILALTIDENKIATKNLLTGRTKEFLFKTIDSFKISIQMGPKGGLRFELILFAQSKTLATIPLSYIENMDQIIRKLEKRLQNLTEDEYGFLRLVRGQENN